MDDLQLARYARHILLNEFGIEGQQALLSSRALVIGAGGLGCACLPYLAAAGIGAITIVDGDDIALSNLQRQILFHTENIAQSKAHTAQTHLTQLNPTISIQAIAQHADGSLLNKLVPQADVVLDCTDNFVIRQIINKACVQYQVPLISGSVIRFAGQVTVFDTRLAHSPCYACAFSPEHDVAEENCALMGVYSPAVALIGATQATETIKLLSGMGVSLVGKLMRLNALTLDWTHIALERDPNCMVCSSSVAQNI